MRLMLTFSSRSGWGMVSPGYWADRSMMARPAWAQNEQNILSSEPY